MTFTYTPCYVIMNLPMGIGSDIRRVREESDIKLTDLAEAIGISKSHLSAIEREVIDNPSLRTVNKIAEALGVSLDRLVRRHGLTTAGAPRFPDKKPPEENKSAVKAVKGLLNDPALSAREQNLAEQAILSFIALLKESILEERESKGGV